MLWYVLQQNFVCWLGITPLACINKIYFAFCLACCRSQLVSFIFYTSYSLKFFHLLKSASKFSFPLNYLLSYLFLSLKCFSFLQTIFYPTDVFILLFLSTFLLLYNVLLFFKVRALQWLCKSAKGHRLNTDIYVVLYAETDKCFKFVFLSWQTSGAGASSTDELQRCFVVLT